MKGDTSDSDKKQRQSAARVGIDEVVHLKSELARVAEALERIQAEKKALEEKLEEAKSAIAASGKLVDDPERRYAGLGGKSIIDRIADHFVENASTTFDPSEVMLYLGIPTGHIDAVRTSFKRLCARRVLQHDGYAKYRLHPEFKES